MTEAAEIPPLTVADGDRSVAIGAPVRDSIIITGDDNTVEMTLRGPGAVLAFAFRWNRPRPRRRRDRRHGGPPRFDNHVDRAEPIAALLPVDGVPRVANVYGAAGIGKTHVLVEALHRGESAMRHGTVYLDGRGRSADDLLHAIFDELYECRVPRRDLRIERLLGSRRALLALEDVELSAHEAQRLALAAPHSRLLVTSGARVLYDARPVALAGLAPEHALAIAEQELGRPLEPHERRTAELIAAQLDGHPLALRQAFSRARDEARGRPLDELEAWLLDPPSPRQRVAALTGTQLRAARAMAVHGDAPLRAEHLRAVAGADAVAAVAELERRHDATSDARGHRLLGAMAQGLVQDDLAAETGAALEHFIAWTAEHAGDSAALLREAAALLALLERAHAAGRWADVVRLGRAVEGAFPLGQRWADWGRVLELILDAAVHCEDAEAEGWARHQLGTRAFGLGHAEPAQAALREALRLRERIGDDAGAAASRQNLRVVTGPAPLLYRLSHVSVALVTVVCALVIGVAGVAGAGLGGGGGDATELVVAVQGDGHVVSDDRAMRCADPVCHDEVERDSEVLLRTRAQRGSEFVGWSGACTGRGACRLTVTADTGVTAVFRRVVDPREVSVTVAGDGNVVSRPAGIACTSLATSCRATFTRARTLDLTATAAPGHRFAGWSGDCDGTARCVVDDDGRRTAVHARFVADPDAVTLAVDVQGDGVGRVAGRPSGIDCGEMCTAGYRDGSRVTLSAVAQPGTRFAGWTGPCASTTGDTCAVVLDGSRRIAARFDRLADAPPPPPEAPAPAPAAPPAPAPGEPAAPDAPAPGDPAPPQAARRLTVAVTGPGTVSSRPAGIDACAERCSAAFAQGRRIVLTATARDGATFRGWRDGGCREGADTCTVTLDRSRDVAARFERVADPAPAASAPDVRIDAPADGREFAEGDRIRYSATVDDHADGDLPDEAIVWREDGTVIGRGATLTHSGTKPGRHTVEVTATNAARLSDSDTVTIYVVPRPNRPPQVDITSPEDGAAFVVSDRETLSRDVPFTATASDADGNPLRYRWTSSAGRLLSTDLSPTLTLRAAESCGQTSHTLTLTVSDGEARAEDKVTVTMVARFGCIN